MTEPMFWDVPYANTDREIWRKGGGDGNGMSHYEPTISVRQTDEIAINVGGTVFTMPVERWHEMALQHYGIRFEKRSRWAFLKESCDAPNWLFGSMALLLMFDGVHALVVWIGG